MSEKPEKPNPFYVAVALADDKLDKISYPREFFKQRSVLAAQVRWLQNELKTLREAIKCSGQEIVPCGDCGETLVGVPDGLTRCAQCAGKNN